MCELRLHQPDDSVRAISYLSMKSHKQSVHDFSNFSMLCEVDNHFIHIFAMSVFKILYN